MHSFKSVVFFMLIMLVHGHRHVMSIDYNYAP